MEKKQRRKGFITGGCNKKILKNRAIIPFKKEHKHYRLYVILDCWSAHTTNKLREKLKGYMITLVFLPTNASRLNDVERVFADVEKKTYWQTQMSRMVSISKVELPIIFIWNTPRKCNTIFMASSV